MSHSGSIPQTLSERRYGAMRQALSGLSPSQIDDELNKHGCPVILRDEIVDRLYRLDGFICREAQRGPQRDQFEEQARYHLDKSLGAED